jgi:hypothetical protein
MFLLLYVHAKGTQISNDQQIFIISHGETISRSCWAPFVVEARIEPSTFRPVVQCFVH